MEKDWVKVYSSTLAYNVELVKQILEQKNVGSIILNQQDSAYVTIGEIELYVKREQVILAKDIIAKSEL